MPKIQCGEAEYRIVGDNGEEGPEMPYEQGATMEAENGDLWAAHVGLDGKDDPVTKMTGGVWLQNLTDGSKLVDVEREEVEFDGGSDYVDFEDEDDDDDAVSDDEDEDGDEDEIEELKALGA